MERRKVQLTGSSTFTISLPKEWAVERGIEPGQQLALRPTGSGTLVVGVEQADRHGRTTLPLDGRDAEEAARTVRAAYTRGFDEFELRVSSGTGPDGGDGPSAEVGRAVREAAGRLAGLEVDDEDDRSIVLRDLLAAEELSVDRLLSKLQFAALSMHRDATTALRTGDRALVRGMDRRRREVRAELATVERCFRRSPLEFDNPDRVDLFDYVAVAERLDRVAAEAVRLTELPAAAERADGGVTAEPDWSDAFHAATRRVHDLVEDGVDAVLADGGLDDARAIRARYDDCREAVDGLDARDPGPPVGATAALRRTAEAGRDLADRAVQHSLCDAPSDADG
jgi:phosphate transport system protein